MGRVTIPTSHGEASPPEATKTLIESPMNTEESVSIHQQSQAGLLHLDVFTSTILTCHLESAKAATITTEGAEGKAVLDNRLY
jgi:hypothetical protein